MQRVALDPFVAPDTIPAANVRVRDRVAITGSVTDLVVRHWAGGVPALHATITDDSGSLTVAFLGRTRVGGVELGAPVVVGGAVILRRGRPLIMNPYLWLLPQAPCIETARAERSLITA